MLKMMPVVSRCWAGEPSREIRHRSSLFCELLVWNKMDLLSAVHARALNPRVPTPGGARYTTLVSPPASGATPTQFIQFSPSLHPQPTPLSRPSPDTVHM